MSERAASPADPQEPSLLLDDQLCFTLYAASRAVTSFYRPLLDKLGLTYPQYLVMLVLWENGSAPVKDLAHALQLDYGTLTPLVKRLEANGLVKRERRSDDERIVEVQLTDSGTALQDRVRTVPLMIGDAMGLDPGEFDRVDALLKRLTANVTRATARATEKAT